ncbi:hypothetical protein ACJX0J_042170 [Zea mays]
MLTKKATCMEDTNTYVNMSFIMSEKTTVHAGKHVSLLTSIVFDCFTIHAIVVLFKIILVLLRYKERKGVVSNVPYLDLNKAYHSLSYNHIIMSYAENCHTDFYYGNKFIIKKIKYKESTS